MVGQRSNGRVVDALACRLCASTLHEIPFPHFVGHFFPYTCLMIAFFYRFFKVIEVILMLLAFLYRLVYDSEVLIVIVGEVFQ